MAIKNTGLATENEGQGQYSAPARQPKAKGFTKRRKILLGIALALVVLGLVAVLYAHQSRQQALNRCEVNQDVLSEMAKKIVAGDIVEDPGAIDKVKNFNNHRENADCLFIITSYHIVMNEVEEAEQYYDLLMTQRGSQISNALLENVYEDPLVYLKKQIDFLKQANEATQNTTIGIGDADEGSGE